VIGTGSSCVFPLAAERQSAAFGTVAHSHHKPASPLKTRVRGFRRTSSGRFSRRTRFRPINTPGLRACGYKTTSGRANWLNRDPIGEQGGVNLYGFTGNNLISRVDFLGQSVYELKRRNMKCSCLPHWFVVIDDTGLLDGDGRKSVTLVDLSDLGMTVRNLHIPNSNADGWPTVVDFINFSKDPELQIVDYITTTREESQWLANTIDSVKGDEEYNVIINNCGSVIHKMKRLLDEFRARPIIIFPQDKPGI
jgi:RHS repeat-associated protein